MGEINTDSEKPLWLTNKQAQELIEEMNAFLQFLTADIKNSPQNIQPFDMSKGRELTADMDVNVDEDICDEE